MLAAAALIPLAWLIGEATEHAAEHTGPGIGGFLNATFGNAPELIIALFAVNAMEFEVVRGSLTGSVVGNLLLVLGFSLLFGGRGEIDRPSSFLALALIAGTTVVLLIPSIPGWEGDPDRDEIVRLSIPVSIVLLIVYVLVTWWSLRRHAALHIASDSEIAGWSLRLALVVLGLATVVTALVAEILVGSIDKFAEDSGLSEFFLAAVVIAIVGNAAEHGGAVVVAYRGKIKLAAEIALASSAQVAVFLIPAVTLLALLIEPLALAFRQVEIAALAISVIVASILLADGRSTRWKGVVLIVVYVGIAIAFYQAGERTLERRRLAAQRDRSRSRASRSSRPRRVRHAGARHARGPRRRGSGRRPRARSGRRRGPETRRRDGPRVGHRARRTRARGPQSTSDRGAARSRRAAPHRAATHRSPAAAPRSPLLRARARASPARGRHPSW